MGDGLRSPSTRKKTQMQRVRDLVERPWRKVKSWIQNEEMMKSRDMLKWDAAEEEKKLYEQIAEDLPV